MLFPLSLGYNKMAESKSSAFLLIEIYSHCKKYFQDLLSQHIFFCQINLCVCDNLLF